MMRGLRGGCLAAALACATAAHAQDPASGPAPEAPGPIVAPFRDAGAARASAPEESRVWSESEDFDRALRRSGSLYRDAALDAYLARILDALFPEFGGALRVRVVNSPDLNAFALPNGSLYVNMGLIARLEDEAQLATVLGHEGAHFVHRHGYQHRQTAKDSTGFALVLGVVGGVGGAIVGNLAAMNAVYGYSREHEREADRIGFERVVARGYDAAAGPQVFSLLGEEAKLLDLPQPVFFASHPRLEERIESYRALAAARGAGDGTRNAQAFAEVTARLRAEWPAAELQRGRAKSVVHVLADAGRRARFPHPDYWLGEAYRLRAEEGDAARAIEALERAIAAQPGFAPPLRALGLLRMKAEQGVEAARLFRRYLELAPQAPQAGFVRQYLAELEQSTPAAAGAREGGGK